MIFATPPQPLGMPAQYAETALDLPKIGIRVPNNLSLDQFIFTYPNRLIALDGGKVLLRLRHDAVIEMDPASSECTVAGWSLTVPYDQIHDISRLMGRRFLQLFSRAKSGKLTQDEESDWTTLLDQIDYQSFSIDRDPPRYVEGTILRKTPKLRVEWHDGEKAYIPPSAGTSLQVLNEGDAFGAFVKWGRSDIELIERVELLTDLAPDERA
jgi:hypothetical protein